MQTQISVFLPFGKNTCLANTSLKHRKILGSGCANCKTTARLVEDIAKEKGVEIQLEKVEDIADIMAYGVISTPAIVIDNIVVHSGGIPDKTMIRNWF